MPETSCPFINPEAMLMFLVSSNVKRFQFYFQCFYTLSLFITVLPVNCSQKCSCYHKFNEYISALICSNTRLKNLSDLVVPKETSGLIANDNRIDELQWSEESSENIHGMEHITLANSSIYSIGPNFFSKLANLTKLRYLNLADNKLEVLNKNISHLRIPEIHLSGNPIECNCDMLWFAQWLHTTLHPTGPRIVKDYEDVRCVGGEWNGKQVYKLTKEQMGCFPITSIREL